MAGKFFVVDTTRCTACRGCQVACKEFNHLEATQTKNRGSYQNPPDLDSNTYRVVRFAEYPAAVNSMTWYFFTDACRHCIDPPCKQEADQIVKDAIVIDENGAVLYTEKTGQLIKDFKQIQDACPWSIPRLDEKNKVFNKCHMCHMRVKEGLLPACVKSCPTGALVFGDEAAMKKLAAERLAAAKKKYGDGARISDADDVRVLYITVAEQAKYVVNS
jgi:formate dehydrogenase iron-sulfur subunit